MTLETEHGAPTSEPEANRRFSADRSILAQGSGACHDEEVTQFDAIVAGGEDFPEIRRINLAC